MVHYMENWLARNILNKKGLAMNLYDIREKAFIYRFSDVYILTLNVEIFSHYIHQIYMV